MSTRSHLAVAGLLAVLVFALGAVVGRVVSPQADGQPAPPASPTPRPEASSTPSDARGPTRARHVRSPQGAIEAATRYGLAVDGPGLLDPARRRDLLARIAAEGARAELVETFAEVGDLISSRLNLTPESFDASGFVWRPVPAGWQLRDYSPDEATVAIWATGVVVVDGLRLAQPGWRTTEVRLRWERDDWRLVEFRTEQGPAPPVPGQLADPAAADRMNAFEPYRYRASEGS